MIPGDQIDFVLVETSEGGNLGACCRALMNCGFERLSLVRPQVEDWPTASKMAVHAKQLLKAANRFDSLAEAVSAAHWVVGVSGRSRKHPERKEPIGPDEFLVRLAELPLGHRVALVFGPERSGLTNAQLGRCQDVLCLPASVDYPSMNLSHAVMVVAWSLRLALLDAAPSSESQRQAASAQDLDGLIEHAARTLTIVGYLDPQNPRLVLDELRKILARSGLDDRELRMLRGMFHRMDVWIARHGGPDTPNPPRRRGTVTKSQVQNTTDAED